MRYNQRFGYIRGLAQPASLGCCGMGSLGAEDCSAHMNAYQIYHRLSEKKDKSKDTRARALQMAQNYLNRYRACVKANAAAQTAPPPAVPVPVTPIITPGYPGYYYGGGGGGGGGGTLIPEVAPETGYSGIIPTGQVTETGQSIYFNQSTGQSFFFDASGQPVYYDPSTGQWGVAQVPSQTQPLTPVPYVQMPTDGGGIESSQQYAQYAQSVQPAQDLDFGSVQYAQMPGYETTQTQQQGAGPTVNEVDFVGYGRAEYYDQWGPIRVLKLVIPKGSPAAQAPAAQVSSTPAPTQASASIYGDQALPGGTMNVEDFTAQYTLSGSHW